MRQKQQHLGIWILDRALFSIRPDLPKAILYAWTSPMRSRPWKLQVPTSHSMTTPSCPFISLSPLLSQPHLVASPQMSNIWHGSCHSFSAYGEHFWSIVLFFPTEHRGNSGILLCIGFDQLEWHPRCQHQLTEFRYSIYYSISNDLTHFLSTHQVRPCG